jgi:hypothetical protein
MNEPLDVRAGLPPGWATVKATPCKGKDLRAGDLFSGGGPDHWENFGCIGGLEGIGQEVWLRTNNAPGPDADPEADVFRLRVLVDGEDGTGRDRVDRRALLAKVERLTVALGNLVGPAEAFVREMTGTVDLTAVERAQLAALRQGLAEAQEVLGGLPEV